MVWDREVIEDPIYEVYRTDRSHISYCPDTDNPNNIGGTDIKDMEYKSVRKGAEMVAM